MARAKNQNVSRNILAPREDFRGTDKTGAREETEKTELNAENLRGEFGFPFGSQSPLPPLISVHLCPSVAKTPRPLFLLLAPLSCGYTALRSSVAKRLSFLLLVAALPRWVHLW
jgi:hypothetical protein